MNKTRIIATILFIIGGSVFSFFLIVRFNPSLYRKMFMHASDKTPHDLDSNLPNTEPIIATPAGNDDFREFMLDASAAVLSDGGSSLNTRILNPDKYEIDTKKVNDYYFMDDEKKNALLSSFREKLLTFDYSSLSEAQQRSYDSMLFYFDNNLSLHKFNLYETQINDDVSGPSSMIDTLNRYTLNSSNDAQTYISIINNLSDFFDKIIEHEKLRSEKGYFMSDSQADVAIARIESLKEEVSKGSLSETFLHRINNLQLSEAEKQDFLEMHDKAVNENVIAGCNRLTEAIKSFKGSSKYEGGLCNYPDGKEYFSAIVDSYTGTKKTTDDYYALIEAYTEVFYSETDSLLKKNRSLNKHVKDFTLFQGDTASMIEALKGKYKDDFEPIKEKNYVITATEDDAEDAHDAFYSMPPIDADFSGTVYVNEKKAAEDKRFFKTAAHETYPGHLYQNMYMSDSINSGNDDIIRYFLNPSGFVEGWGVYAGFYAYDYTDTEDRDLAEICKVYDEASICILGKADFMVNYYGNSLDELTKSLIGYGYSSDDVEKIYDYVVNYPGEYSKYCLGFLEIKEMQRKAKELKGDSYSDAAFNKFMMKTGPMAFKDIEKRLYEM